jgi:hypothetical protein
LEKLGKSDEARAEPERFAELKKAQPAIAGLPPRATGDHEDIALHSSGSRLPGLGLTKRVADRRIKSRSDPVRRIWFLITPATATYEIPY